MHGEITQGAAGQQGLSHSCTLGTAVLGAGVKADTVEGVDIIVILHFLSLALIYTCPKQFFTGLIQWVLFPPFSSGANL